MSSSLLNKNKNAKFNLKKVSKPFCSRVFKAALLVLLISGLFLWLLIVSAKAATIGDLIITEIMYNPDGTDENREWLEIFNQTDQALDLTNWKFFEQNINHKLSGNLTLAAKTYAVIVDDQNSFMLDYPNYTGLIIDSSFSLKNSGEYLALKDDFSTVIDEIIYKQFRIFEF